MKNKARIGLGLALAVLLAGCSSWGSSSAPKPQTIEMVAPLLGVQQAWTARVGAGFKPPLAMQAKGRVVSLASSDGQVLALDSSSGQILWQRALQEPLSAAIGFDGDTVAVVSANNELIVLQAGQEKWRQRLQATVFTPPLVAGGRVFVLATDRSVQALDAANGYRLWTQSPGTSSDSLVLQQAGALAASGNSLLVGIHGRMVALQPDSGSVLWESALSIPRGTNEIERLVELVAPISKHSGSVCARAFQSALACLDTGSGRMAWSQKAQGVHGVAGDAQTVYGIESNGMVQAWGRNNGTLQWSSELLKHRKLSPPLLVGRSVVVGDHEGNLYFLSKTDGSLLNRLKTDDSGISAQPMLAENTLVVTTVAGKIYGFRPE